MLRRKTAKGEKVTDYFSDD